MRALLRDQFPDLADLPLVEVGEGWDSSIYRLGDNLTARLPRRAVAAELVAHEQRWLPLLAPRLPLPVPAPVQCGRPGRGYPWAWSVVPWFPGDVAARCPPDDAVAAADALGRFVAALHKDAPVDAPRNPYRGIPLIERHDRMVDAVTQLHDVIDSQSVMACWADLVETPPWPHAPVWLHGDLHPANVLVHEGLVSAVIDFGDITSGDPATDLSIAWMMFPAAARATFRAAAGPVDDDTWARARGWALALGVVYVESSADRPLFEQLGRRVIDAALHDD